MNNFRQPQASLNDDLHASRRVMRQQPILRIDLFG